MENKRKKGVIVGVIAAICLVLIFGVTFAIWTYSNTLQNQVLISGDVFMKYTESNELSITNALPKAEPGDDDYFEFTIEGRNKYSKPIWYEIVLNWGEEPTGDENTERTERIKDNLLMFRLVETKDGVDKTVLDNASYSNIKDGKAIWINTIDANTDNVEITYKLYMWISPKTNIGNTSLADYDMETWNDNVFASIKVSVNGDFDEKEIKSEIGTDVVKDTIGQAGGVIGVKSDNTPTTSKDDEVREYRYSGNDGIKNYIYFNCSDNTTYETASSNCEIWRIIGVFKDESGEEHLKIVNNKVLTRDMFPATFSASGTEYNIQYTSGNYAYWNKKTSGTYNNDWATAGLQYWLNAGIDKYTKQPSDGYMSYLSKNAKDMIKDTKYYLGTVTYDPESYTGIIDNPKEAYANERDVASCVENTGKSESENGCKVWKENQATWEGKIALMYPSDYGFSVSSENDNWDKQLKDFSSIKSASWMNSMPSNYGWLLSPSSHDSTDVANWDTTESVSSLNVSSNIAVRPSVNLISDIKITDGDGSLNTPYYPEIA